jgi:hypothetical protein
VTSTPTPDDTQDTSVTADASTGEGTQQPTVDPYEKRYNDLQPEYTRATQEAAELRRRDAAWEALMYADDQDTRQQAAQALGIELAEDGADDTQYDDPTDALRAELEQLKQTVSGDLTARQQQEQIASLEAAAESSMDTLQVPKDEAVRDWLVSRAVALPPTKHGTLDIEQAWKQFGALMDAQKKTWANTKRTHAFAPGGGEGTQAPDLSTHAGRVQHMLTQLQNGDG